MEEIILVDEKDLQIGIGEKLETHRKGALHRAFSDFVFNADGKLLLQQRAKTKYHCAGLWSNTCCGHPRPGEPLEKATHRRLQEEMGFVCDLREAFSFIYKVKFDNGLYEHEFDHVFIGHFDGEPEPNPDEVEAYKWIAIHELARDIEEHPERYTYWLRTVIDRLILFLEQ